MFLHRQPSHKAAQLTMLASPRCTLVEWSRETSPGHTEIAMANVSDPNAAQMDGQQLNSIEISPARGRQTPQGSSFAEQMKAGMLSAGGAVSSGLSAAGYSIPGASVITAALSKTGINLGSSSGALSSGSNATGVSLTSSSSALSTNSSSSSSSSTSSSSSSSSSLLAATQQMQELNQTFNLQYLQLQENEQAQSRQYTALSNIMKSKSDTAKNSLSNLK